MARPIMRREDQVSPDASSHIRGVHKGEEQSGRKPAGRRTVRTSRTSRDATSINAERRAPIDPRMPNMPPA